MSMQQVFIKHDLHCGRVLNFSKSSYRRIYPNHFIVFNANIITKEEGKIWYGDLDLALDEKKLKNVAKELKKDLYVLCEMDCRFEREKDSAEILINKAVWSSDKGRLVKE